MSATCRTCGAPIRWAVTAAGRRMPLDTKPVTLFVLVGSTDEQGNQRVDTRTGYVSHFATCPQAAEHRRAQ